MFKFVIALRSVAFLTRMREIMGGFSKAAFGIFNPSGKNKNEGFALQAPCLRISR